MQPKFRERFAGTDTDKAYHLSFSGLDSTAVTAKILNSSGDWVSKADCIRDVVLPEMNALRAVCDEAETLTDAKAWPFPTYGELLFGVK